MTAKAQRTFLEIIKCYTINCGGGDISVMGEFCGMWITSG